MKIWSVVLEGPGHGVVAEEEAMRGSCGGI